MGQALSSLALIARIEHYRASASEMLRCADAAKTAETRSAYLRLAMSWKELADDSERLLLHTGLAEPMPVPRGVPGKDWH